MITYKYSLLSKLIYRYANIIATLFLLIYVVASFFLTMQKWYYVFVMIVNLLIIFYLNRYYFKTYRIFPFKISADNQRIICSDFFFSNKIIEIDLQNIDKISGGIFSGWPTRPVYIYDGTKNITIAFYTHVGNFKNLLKTILENIPQNVYDELLNKIKTAQGLK